MKTLRGKMSRVSAMLLAVMMMLLSVQWGDFETTQAEAADVAYKYFEMNFDDPSQLNGDPFYLYSQDGVQGCEVQNGVLVKNGKHPIFGLSMYEKYGENGKLTAQFDLRAERGASRTAPWNTVYFGLRQPTDQATGYMSGGIWLSFKDNTIGFRFNTWALTTEMTVPINISDSRHKIYVEDDQDANRINIWVDDVHEATLVIQEPSTISIYDASGNLVETQEVAHEITKGGFITWWCHDLETMEMDNVKVWMPEVSAEPYVPVDESLIQNVVLTDLSGSTSELKGDVNADSAITVADVIALQRYLLDTLSLTSAQCTRADMTSDGTLNGFDLAILKRVLLNG